MGLILGRSVSQVQCCTIEYQKSYTYGPGQASHNSLQIVQYGKNVLRSCESMQK